MSLPRGEGVGTNRETEAVFHEVADLPAAERERYFNERQVPRDVRAEVEALLRIDAADDSLTECVAGAAQGALRTVEGEVAGDGGRCGAYRLVRLVGRGGMGAVYLGER